VAIAASGSVRSNHLLARRALAKHPLALHGWQKSHNKGEGTNERPSQKPPHGVSPLAVGNEGRDGAENHRHDPKRMHVETLSCFLFVLSYPDVVASDY